MKSTCFGKYPTVKLMGQTEAPLIKFHFIYCSTIFRTADF